MGGLKPCARRTNPSSANEGAALAYFGTRPSNCNLPAAALVIALCRGKASSEYPVFKRRSLQTFQVSGLSFRFTERQSLRVIEAIAAGLSLRELWTSHNIGRFGKSLGRPQATKKTFACSPRPGGVRPIWRRSRMSRSGRTLRLSVTVHWYLCFSAGPRPPCLRTRIAGRPSFGAAKVVGTRPLGPRVESAGEDGAEAGLWLHPFTTWSQENPGRRLCA